MTHNIPRFTRRPVAAVAAGVLAALSVTVVSAQPASASSHRPCTIVKHSNTNGVTKVGTATATVGTDGIKLATAAGKNEDKVSWRENIRPVLASTVEEVSYETVKLDQAGAGVNDAALPAYHLFVKTPAGEGTLIFEPYYYLMDLGAGNPQRQIRTEWNVLQGKLWTSSTTINGLPKSAGGPATKTFAQIVADNPRMTVTGVGFGLGTYNPGTTAILDEQRFATKQSCSEHQWSTGFRTGLWWPGWLR
ncbi:hypothetical protein Aab01nite_55980 [Paractinoplanes abujensis]|uniref:Uncharacterized protein n=1 Tax=Paractinoplanes abujensis TaxID=882441 RepID=A0A7W7CZR0_9ACTN|nr:hypothetical protein [Actinoplanes abujensis]MBB4696021.1 hypothetical protein [Actinoplanes abujensis]GID22008.1 hypothetical protein Aab01nite_55980 [Actinoplanes abujensis]